MTPRIALRMATFIVVAAYLVAGPFYRQFLDGRSRYFPKWTMYSGSNLDLCEVRFHTAGAAVDRFGVLGFDPWYTAKPSFRRLGSEDEIWRQGRQICAKLGPGTDLRADVRCADRTGTGWTPGTREGQNLCGASIERSRARDLP